MRLPRSTRLVRLTTLLVAVVAAVVPFVISSARSDAAPANDRAHHGYDSVGTNGFGATESWAGNLRLFTGHDQTGEMIVGYCIQRGLSYPRGTDPQFADANSGFALIGDVPAQRGVSASDRATLAYALWRYGVTTDDRTAAVMFLLTHLLSADPDFGSTTLESTVLGRDWPDPPAVMARAREILDESRALRGPWTIDVDVERAADGGAGGTVTAELAGPGGPVGGVDVVLTIDVGTADRSTREVVLETGDDGRVTHALDVTEVGPLESGDVDRAGDASDVTEAGSPDAGGGDVADVDADAGDHPDMLDHEVALVAVMVTAEVAVTPGGYRVFHGRPGTQQVITNAGDGPPVAASTAGEITVPLPPPPVTTTTVPVTTTTTVVTTTTVPVTTTTVPPTTTTAPEPPPAVAPPTTVAPAPVPERPARPASVAEPVLADTGGGVHLAPVGLLIVALGSTMVGAARRLGSVPAPAWVPVSRWGRRRGGSHLR